MKPKRKPRRPLMAVDCFRDPALSERHLLLLLLYQVTRLRADVAAVQNLQITPRAAAQFATLAEFCHRQAFDDLEDAIRQFETQGQRPSLQ